MRIGLDMPKYIKPSVELDKLGVEPDLRQELLNSMQFPSILPPQYMPIWENFIDTDSIQELHQHYKKARGLMYVTQAFCSYLSNIDSTQYYDFEDSSKRALRLELDYVVRNLKELMRRKQFHQFRPLDLKVKLNNTYNEVLKGYFQLEADVIFVFGPNKKKSKKVETTFGSKRESRSLSEQLYEHSSYMFGSPTPPDAVLGKAKPNGIRIIPKHGDLAKLRNYFWGIYKLGSFDAHIVRSGETFAVKLKLNSNHTFFTGSARQSVAKVRIETLYKEALRKLYE
tara:strand:- start:4436 stop:5284 length:849 start_codon:yes stop_codon:yes gene_type:complete